MLKTVIAAAAFALAISGVPAAEAKGKPKKAHAVKVAKPAPVKAPKSK